MSTLPLVLKKGDHVVFIGNTLFDRGAQFPHFEAMLQKGHADLGLVMRTLAWAGDEVDLMPRPENFGTLNQHLTAQKADVIFAAFGFNESFGGVEKLPEFKQRLTALVQELKTHAYNGKTGPRIVLVSPTANEDIKGVPAASMNNARIAAYTKAMAEVAAEKKVIDWEAIERDYRAGILSLREIAAVHGCSHVAISKRARAEAWARDLAAKIQALVDAVNGAFMLIRRAALEQVGPFDEGYRPAYFEEADFCAKARAAGRANWSTIWVVYIWLFSLSCRINSSAALELSATKRCL